MLCVVRLSEVIMSWQWLRQQKELWGTWASCHFMTLCSSKTRGRVFLNLMCDFSRWQIQHGHTSYITRQICVCIGLYNTGNQHGSFRLCFTLSPHATWGCYVILVPFNCSKINPPSLSLSLAPEEFVSLAEMEDTLLRNLFGAIRSGWDLSFTSTTLLPFASVWRSSQLVDVVRQTHICTATSERQGGKSMWILGLMTSSKLLKNGCLNAVSCFAVENSAWLKFKCEVDFPVYVVYVPTVFVYCCLHSQDASAYSQKQVQSQYVTIWMPVSTTE